MELTLALPVVLDLVELSADFHHPEVESLAEAAAGLEEQSEAAAEPSVEVAAPVGAEEMDVLEVPGVGGWLLPSEEFVAVFAGQRARAVVPPGPQEEEEAELPVGAA